MDPEPQQYMDGVVTGGNSKFLYVSFTVSFGNRITYSVPRTNAMDLENCVIGSWGIVYGSGQYSFNWGFIPLF